MSNKHRFVECECCPITFFCRKVPKNTYNQSLPIKYREFIKFVSLHTLYERAVHLRSKKN